MDLKRGKSTLRAVAVSLLLLAGCREAPHPMDPLVLPPAADLFELQVTRLNPDGSRQSDFKVQDRRKMEEVLAELRTDNTGYVSAMEGRAPQEYSVALDSNERMEAMIWIGPGWLGGVDDKHKDEKGALTSHYRKLSPEQHARLVALLKPAE
jgi:hypothetical protein